MIACQLQDTLHLTPAQRQQRLQTLARAFEQVATRHFCDNQNHRQQQWMDMMRTAIDEGDSKAFAFIRAADNLAPRGTSWAC